MIEALHLRVEGVQNLADALRQTAGAKVGGDATLLSQQGDRLVASDVVWSDLFQAPSEAELKQQGVSGVAVPGSVFVASRDLVTTRSMSYLLQRLRGASTSGKPTGLHGTNLVEVKALPANQVLSQTTENTVTGSVDLAFAVTIKDSGDSQEVGIKVTLTLQKDAGGKPVTQTKTIKVINPGQEATVSFSGFNLTSFYAMRSRLLVDVAAVPGETKTDNNKGTYPVIFSL
jgi:hypothetical protein